MSATVVILGATHGNAPAGLAPIEIGLALTLIRLISISITNISVNPARSTGPALFVGGWALQQLWLFRVAPIIGGFVYRWLSHEPHSELAARVDRGVLRKNTGPSGLSP